MAEFEQSPIEIEGYCLLFDVDRIDHMINRQCVLDIPDRIPIIWENYMGAPENVIGTCWVSRIDDTGVFVKGILQNLSTDRRDKLIDCSENFVYPPVVIK